MTWNNSRSRLALLGCALTGSVLLSLAPANAATPPLAPGRATPGCATPMLTEPTPAAAVEGTAAAKAARTNALSKTRFARLATDPTLWLDRCGQAFYAEPRIDARPTTPAPAHTGAVAGVENPLGTLPPGTDPMALASRPGAPRTIYLDFGGDQVTGTGWNDTYAAPTLNAEAFSITAPADANFSADEQDAIYRAWLVVAEDYAPFNVNVTTRDPGAAALDRTDASDRTYGAHVVITDNGPIGKVCGCAGIAYINVFDFVAPRHLYYQPAWVFAEGVGFDGWSIGEAASHEVGHNFGLRHDGTGDPDPRAYYWGNRAWAPIMGASYYGVLSQFSAGTYPGANNTQDDLSIIALGAPVLADDFGNTLATAAPLLADTPVEGLVETSRDLDAFTFTASRATTVSVTAATPVTNLDIALSIYDADGTRVAYVNPALNDYDEAHPIPAALSATWTKTLPDEPATYTAIIDGSDNLNRLPDGSYDDYGSLGRYRIVLSTSATPETPDRPTFATKSLHAGKAHRAYRRTITLNDSTSDISWSITSGRLPKGLKMSVANDGGSAKITGKPKKKGAFAFTVQVSTPDGAVSTHRYRIKIR